MNNLPHTEEAYDLLHQGAIALAQVEANGIRIDTEYLDRTMERLDTKIKRLQGSLRSSTVGKVWETYYKERTNFDSNTQLGTILFDVLGHECPAETASGKHKTDEKTLATINHPFVKRCMTIRKMQKTRNTFLQGIHHEVVPAKFFNGSVWETGGLIHPVFNLHLVKTFRSSSDSPNFHNFPVRDPKIAKIIRQAFIARPGHRLVEIDYSGIEVRVAACYHKDPRMLSYLNDNSTDMHRDMAMEVYLLPQEEVTKTIRYCGKNGFVFPEFYGSTYTERARELWGMIGELNLTLEDGTSLYDHLESHGIRGLGELGENGRPPRGSFLAHIQSVENDFWERRFRVYHQWRNRWVKQYRERGWILSKTGFICQGYMLRNEIINYPIQGSAFHCLLWSLIRLQKEIKRRGMKTLLVGQIHDSIVADVPDEELGDYLALAKKVMTVDLKKAWKWICVPIEIEAEVTPVDGNWYQKKEVEI